ncbi:hypothetical protein AHF37_12178 [Paragonimus kellicotti]|nr:hypothetical protein AHF37_12178 [Paragonimus kellicotti]
MNKYFVERWWLDFFKGNFTHRHRLVRVSVASFYSTYYLI